MAFAAWIASQCAEDRVIPVHVLEADHLQAVLQHHHLAEVKDAAKIAMAEQFARHDRDGAFDEPQLVEGGSAEARIDLIRDEQSADVVIVNRFATASRRRLRRLGRVARRTLRRLQSPVITVPPLVTRESVGHGPVIATTNLTEECESAVEFAADIAERTGRALVLVNVRRLPDHHAAHYLGDDSKDKMRESRQAEAEQALREWVESKGLEPAEQVVLLGEVVSNVSDYAQQRDACVVVAGSRRLSNLERLFLTSVGRGLSATAPCPVAVVPPRTVPS